MKWFRHGRCLFDYPTNVETKHCGNGIIENGEECDCGGPNDCKKLPDQCCDPYKCKLFKNATCSGGECCDNCQPKARGIVCREKV